MTEDAVILRCAVCDAPMPFRAGKGAQKKTCDPCRTDPYRRRACIGCKETKPQAEFYVDRAVCKCCVRQRSKETRRASRGWAEALTCKTCGEAFARDENGYKRIYCDSCTASPDTLKSCFRCKLVKPRSEFYGSGIGGRWCKPCTKAYQKERWRRNNGWTDRLSCAACGDDFSRREGRGRDSLRCDPCRSDPDVAPACTECRIRKPRLEFRRRNDGAWHGVCKTCEAPRVKAYQRQWHLLRKYEMTQTEFEDRIADQDGACAICWQEPTRLRDDLITGFHVDHNPLTGRVRGLLCNGDNTGIGSLGHDPIRLRNGALYCELDGWNSEYRRNRLQVPL